VSAFSEIMKGTLINLYTMIPYVGALVGAAGAFVLTKNKSDVDLLCHIMDKKIEK
jgi:hypothetical protein